MARLSRSSAFPDARLRLCQSGAHRSKMMQWACPKAGHRDGFRARHRRRARRYLLAARSSFLPGLEKPLKSAVFAPAPGLFSRPRPRTDVWPQICMSCPGCVRKWNSPMRVQGRRSAPHSGAVEAGDAFKVRVATSLQAVEGAWRALESSAFCTPFQTYDWLTAYVQGAGPAGATRDRHRCRFVERQAADDRALCRRTPVGRVISALARPRRQRLQRPDHRSHMGAQPHAR